MNGSSQYVLTNTGAGTSVTNIDSCYSDNAYINVNGKFILSGEDLNERLCRIEQLLGIPQRNIALEKEFPKLKQTFDAYIAAHCQVQQLSEEMNQALAEYQLAIDQYQTWSALSAE